MDILKLMYEHWIVTSLWMFICCPWNNINILAGSSEEGKLPNLPPRPPITRKSDLEMPDGVPVREDSAGHGIL